MDLIREKLTRKIEMLLLGIPAARSVTVKLLEQSKANLLCGETTL